MIFGSHNYNLNTPESDIDIVEFLIPTIDNLYDGVKLHGMKTSEEMDVRTIDIRHVSNIVRRPCINDLEYFCSVKPEFTSRKTKELYEYINSNIELIVENCREGISLSCIGYMADKLKDAVKSSESRAKSIEMYMYDVKSLYAFFRNDYILEQLITGKREFKDIIFIKDEALRSFLIEIKTGKMADMYDNLFASAEVIREKRASKTKPAIIKSKIERVKSEEYNAFIKNVDAMVKDIVISSALNRGV